MKIIDALKKLYAAQGGTPADVAGMKKTADVIEAIADNGGGGGGSGLVVNMTKSETESVIRFTAEKTAEEIFGAFIAATPVVLVASLGEMGTYYMNITTAATGGGYYSFYTYFAGNETTLDAESADAYPYFELDK